MVMQANVCVEVKYKNQLINLWMFDWRERSFQVEEKVVQERRQFQVCLQSNYIRNVCVSPSPTLSRTLFLSHRSDYPFVYLNELVSAEMVCVWLRLTMLKTCMVHLAPIAADTHGLDDHRYQQQQQQCTVKGYKREGKSRIRWLTHEPFAGLPTKVLIEIHTKCRWLCLTKTNRCCHSSNDDQV